MNPGKSRQTDPPHQPDATVYFKMGTAVLEQTTSAQAAIARAGGGDAVRPDILADSLAHNYLSVYRNEQPAEPLPEVKSAITQSLQGVKSYEVSIRDRFGTGIDIRVTSDSRVELTPVQSLVDGRQVKEMTREFRWKGEGHQTGHLEIKVGPVDNQFIPFVNPTIGNDGERGTELQIDNTISGAEGARGDNSPADAVTRAAVGGSSREGELRVVRDGVLTSARNGYQQSGSIVYDGFTVVEQNVGRGATVVYSKHDLERMASPDRAALDRALSSDSSVRIGISGGQLSIQSQSQGLDVSRGHSPPTLQR